MARRVSVGLLMAVLMACPLVAYSQEKKKDQPAAPAAEKKEAPNAKPAKPALPPADAGKTPPTDAGKSPAAGGPDEALMMAAMTPGPPHQKLAKLVGDWTIKTKMTIPGGPAEESEGTAKLAMAFDGRFLHEDDAGTMMGMPFKGGKLLGYNNGSKKYEAVWVYTLGTGMLTMNGASEDGGKTIKFTATFDNEIGVKETMNVTYKFADDDHFTVVLDGGKMPDGSPGPVMNAEYTRKK